MANDTAKTITTNIVPVQGTFEPLPPYECINLIGPAGTPFFAPVNPNLDGVSITNSTIDSSVIGGTTPAAGTFTDIATTTGTITSPPSGPDSIVNQAYVDAVAQGLAFKQPANYKSIGNLTLSGLATQAGGDWPSTLTAGMRILVTDQTTASQNGIYVAASGAWSRSSDANTWDELVAAYLFVLSGATWGGSSWVNTNQPGGTLGTTAVTFVQFSNNATYTAGTGLTLAGFQFSITNTGVAAATYGSASAVPVIAVNAQGQITSASNTNIAIDAGAITSGTIDSARISGDYSGITGVGTLTNLSVTNTITGSISGNAATATTAGSATTATTATNLAGGATGSVPYQSGAGATTFVGIGSTGQVLTVAGGVPTWATPATYGDVSGPASSVDNQIARFDGTTGKIIQTSSPTISDAGAIGNVNEINWDITPTGVVGGAGSLSWNDNDNTQTLDLVGAGGNVTMALGEETYYRVKASANITKGQVVMFTGTVGASGGLEAAPATGLTAATSQYVMGIAAETFTSGNWGYIAAFGEVRGFDTTGGGESWINGQILYLNPSVAGGLTKTVPAAPAAKVEVCAVVYADASVGSVFVRPTFFPSFNQLNDVSVGTPSGGDLVVWDSGDSRWESAAQSTITAGKATNLAGGAAGSLPYQSNTDTTTFLAAGSDGQVLKLASGVPTWSSDASGVTIADDTTTNATRYLTFTDATTGNETTLDVSSTKLTFNPSTGVLASTGFSGSGASLTSLDAGNISTGTLAVARGGTGITSFGTGVATWLGTPSSANLASAVTDETGTGALVFANTPTLVTPVLGTPTSGNLSNCTVDGTNAVGYRNLPAVGTKTTSYTLQTADVGKYVQVGSGGSITIPDATFAEGDAVSIFNNTTGDITITCTITTAYIAGTDSDKASVTLATRGVATILFISSTVCVITGNVT